MSKLNHKFPFQYPFEKTDGNIWNTPYSIKLAVFLRRLLPGRKKKRYNNVEIWPAYDKHYAALSDADFPLIFVVHNGMRYLRSFLKHYRQMGVTRFVCVEDQSADGTTEFLTEQPDVDVYFSNVRYREAARSKTWRELLAEKYGKNRWYLNVDVDEYLFTGCTESVSIKEYADKLFANRIRRLPAPMIDMIPGGKLSDAILTGDDETMPWEVCRFFDKSGYDGYLIRSGIKLFGGPRTRIYDAVAELMKYPLIYWDDDTSMGASVHSPKPGHHNHAPYCGCLLHFKIFEDACEMSEKAIDSGQYFEDSREYRRMHKFFSESGEENLLGEDSVEFSGEVSLLENGIVVPLVDR